MKNFLIIFIAALPFYGLVSFAIPKLNTMGNGIFIIDFFSVTAYWPVTLIFHFESFIYALLVSIPFAVLISWFNSKSNYVGIGAGIFSYALLTFIFCLQSENLTPCLYTLVQSVNIYIYFSIGMLSICFCRYFSKFSLD